MCLHILADALGFPSRRPPPSPSCSEAKMTFDEDHAAFGPEKFPESEGSSANLAASPAPSLSAPQQQRQVKPPHRRIQVHAPSSSRPPPPSPPRPPLPWIKYSDYELAKIQLVRRRRAGRRGGGRGGRGGRAPGGGRARV